MSDTHSEAALHSAYVRKEMLPEREPPVSQKGAVLWMRENLFSSIPNAIMTIVSLYVIYYVLSGVGPWMLGGIWDADSLSECRAIRNELYGEHQRSPVGP